MGLGFRVLGLGFWDQIAARKKHDGQGLEGFWNLGSGLMIAFP